MACPWLLLSNLFLTYGGGYGHGASGHKTLHELYPGNPKKAIDSPSHSNLSATTFKDLATLPFFRTVVARNALSTQTPVLDNLRMLYLALGQFDVEYIARFGDVRPVFVVCRSPKAAELVLKFLPEITRSSGEERFAGEIYSPAYWSRGRIEAWPQISLWVSIEGRDLRLRVRAVNDLFKGFRDLSWQFRGNCHHRSGENDHDKDGEITLWVETSGSRKDFTTPSVKGKRPERIQSHLENLRTDSAIKTIQSGIQDRLSEGRVVVGLQLVFTNVRDSMELKRWLVSSPDGGNDNGGRELGYPPAFRLSAMRRSQAPVPPPLWSSPFGVGSQTRPISGHIYDSATEPKHVVFEGNDDNSRQSETGPQQTTTIAHHCQHLVVDKYTTACGNNFATGWTLGVRKIPRKYQ